MSMITISSKQRHAAASRSAVPLALAAGLTMAAVCMPSSAAVILYSQLDNASGNGAPAQTFEAAFSAYDSMGADDFVVTGDGWNITEVQLVFSLTGGSQPDVNISFYNDDGGLPGDLVQQFLAPFAGGVASLGAGLNLMPGTYWLGVTFDRIFGGGGGQIFWSNRTTQSGFAGVWQNPGGGFGLGCLTWDAQTTCRVGGGSSPDYLFQLSGSLLVNGGPTPVPVPGTLALALVALGGMGLSRRRRG